jgi:hypothetical protein
MEVSEAAGRVGLSASLQPAGGMAGPGPGRMGRTGACRQLACGPAGLRAGTNRLPADCVVSPATGGRPPPRRQRICRARGLQAVVGRRPFQTEPGNAGPNATSNPCGFNCQPARDSDGPGAAGAGAAGPRPALLLAQRRPVLPRPHGARSCPVTPSGPDGPFVPASFRRRPSAYRRLAGDWAKCGGEAHLCTLSGNWGRVHVECKLPRHESPCTGGGVEGFVVLITVSDSTCTKNRRVQHSPGASTRDTTFLVLWKRPTHTSGHSRNILETSTPPPPAPPLLRPA